MASWQFTQTQYQTFLNIWRNSATSNEVLQKLYASPHFPNTAEISRGDYSGGTVSVPLTLNRIQGYATWLRWRLYTEAREENKNITQGDVLPYLKAEKKHKPRSTAHINFAALL